MRCRPFAAPVVLAATAGAPKASAAGLRLIDFAERLVSPEQIKAAGFDGALVYVSELRPGATFDFKPVTREFADGLRAQGLHVVSCYQFGKPGWPNSPSDFTRGFDGGVADAQTALRLHGAAGGPDSAPIYFSVDEPHRCGHLEKPCGAVVSRHQLGAGCRSAPGSTAVWTKCGWAIADGVVGHSTTPGFRWAWQTRAWSGGQLEPAAVLFQREVVTATDPGAVIDGVHVDVDDVLAPDFGQWDLAR